MPLVVDGPCYVQGAEHRGIAEGGYGEVVVADRSPINVVPANQATWEDIEAVVGKARCWDSLCFCQRFKLSIRRNASTGLRDWRDNGRHFGEFSSLPLSQRGEPGKESR